VTPLLHGGKPTESRKTRLLLYPLDGEGGTQNGSTIPTTTQSTVTPKTDERIEYISILQQEQTTFTIDTLLQP